MAFLTSVTDLGAIGDVQRPRVHGSRPLDGRGRRLKSFLIAAADHHRGPFRGKLTGHG